MMSSTPISRVTSALFALSVLIALGGWLFAYRLVRAEASLQTTVTEQGEAIQKLSHKLADAEELTSEMQGEVAFTKNSLGSTQQEIHKAQQKVQQSSAQLARQQKQWDSQLGQIKEEQAATQGSVGILTSDVAEVKGGLSSTNEQVASTRSDLQRTIGDLGVQSDLIARNHSELEELRALGGRDYVEFDLRKNKQPQRVGNVAIGLRKADLKRQRYTINLVADDHNIEKKDKTVNEPVQFYQAGYRQPSEIVVNQVDKDRIVGYVSFPKKKEDRTTLQQLSGPGPVSENNDLHNGESNGRLSSLANSRGD